MPEKFDIEKRRKELKLSQEEVANKVGVTKATVSKWEKGDVENMKRDKIANLAHALKISPLLLLGMEDVTDKDKVYIPVLGTIACGDPILASENIDGYVEEIAETLPMGKLFYLHSRGDSMVPTIPQGSNVLIRQQEVVEDGEVAAVLVNGDTEATLKRVKRQGNLVLLVADNPEYDPIVITKDNPARIIGKAIKASFDVF